MLDYVPFYFMISVSISVLASKTAIVAPTKNTI
nr:MAG TPA: hypothetical protein [Caudoviricetes sp.]